jgi:hypothetical protein
MAYVARFRKERVNTTRVVAGFVFLGKLFPKYYKFNGPHTRIAQQKT